ncbi:unnamed protein product [Closterium sp. NIES-53]
MDPKLSHSAPRSPVPSSCRPLSHPTLPSFPLPVQIPGNPTSGDGDAGGKEVEMAEGEQGGREAMLRGQGSLSGGAKMHMGGGRSGGAGKAGGGDGWGDDGWGEEREVVHVRARRGQATDSHSIAERMRREKISDRMKVLQALVPSCAKVTGKAVMLDEIINYVRSLQLQVELLSSKLAAMDYGNLASLGDPSAFEDMDDDEAEAAAAAAAATAIAAATLAAGGPGMAAGGAGGMRLEGHRGSGDVSSAGGNGSGWNDEGLLKAGMREGAAGGVGADGSDAGAGKDGSTSNHDLLAQYFRQQGPKDGHTGSGLSGGAADGAAHSASSQGGEGRAEGGAAGAGGNVKEEVVPEGVSVHVDGGGLRGGVEGGEGQEVIGPLGASQFEGLDEDGEMLMDMLLARMSGGLQDLSLQASLSNSLAAAAAAAAATASGSAASAAAGATSAGGGAGAPESTQNMEGTSAN